MTPNSRRFWYCRKTYAPFEFRLSRRNTAEVNIGVFRRSCRAMQRRSLKDVVRLALLEKRPATGSPCTAGREAFIVISRANSSNISEFGPERRVLISSLGWLSVFVYERPLYFLYLLLLDFFPASFFAMLVFSLSLFVSLSLISLLFFLPRTPSTRSPLVELLSLLLLLFSYLCLCYYPSPAPFRRNSLLSSSRSPRAFQTLPSSRVSPTALLPISLHLNRPFSISHFLYCATYALAFL